MTIAILLIVYGLSNLFAELFLRTTVTPITDDGVLYMFLGLAWLRIVALERGRR